MGFADRDYQSSRTPTGGGFFQQVTPAVAWLLVLNIGIYFLDLLLEGQAGGKILRSHGIFYIPDAVYGGAVWQFITFQFLHGHFLHLLFNCLGIFFFGPWLERWWGSARFVVYYLLCGMGGAAFYMLLVIAGVLPSAGLVGASAGLYGILVGVAVIAPNLRVALLFPPIELSMRQLAMAVIAIAAGSILFRIGGNEGGEAGHLGGAILGFLIMRYPRLLGGRGGFKVVRAKPTIARPLPKLRPRSEIEKQHDSEVDVILDKISRDGFQSLTQAERDLLNRVSQQKKNQ